jgi:hypothetical protein
MARAGLPCRSKKMCLHRMGITFQNGMFNAGKEIHTLRDSVAAMENKPLV